MKCPKCGFVSYNYLESCKRCGAGLSDYKRRLGIADPSARVRPFTPKEPLKESPKEPKTSDRERRIAQEIEHVKREAAREARTSAERAAREEAEKIKLMVERQAREEAEALRKKMEEEADLFRRRAREKAEREAREEAARIRLTAEREAKERADFLRRQAEEDADRLRRQAVEEADLLRAQAREDAERHKREAEKEAEALRRRSLDKPAEPAPEIVEVDIDWGGLLTPAAPLKADAEPGVRTEGAKPTLGTGLPQAADYVEILAHRADRAAKEPVGTEEKAEEKKYDFPPFEESEEILPGTAETEAPPAAYSAEAVASAAKAGRAAVEAAVAEAVPVEEIYEEIIEEDLDRRASRNSMTVVPKGGLIIRGAGAFLDFAILTVILGAFLFLGRSVLHVGGSDPSWTAYLRISGPIYILFLLIMTVYSSIFIGSSGQTPGMMVLGLKVVNHKGETIGYNLAFLRQVASLFSILLFGMGLWWIPLDLNKQAWHDKLTQSVVVRV